MKILALCLSALLLSGPVFGQQPFENYGYKVKVATLSRGEYNEFFDRDTLVQIGTVVLNTITGKITHFVTYDTSYSEATLQPELISRWISPDPLAEKYYNFSPYNFVLNNPINFTDPDGRDVVFDISRNKKGEITGVSLRATVYITGDGASSERASELNSTASRVLRPGASKNGVSISFNINYKYSKDITAGDLKAGENMLTFHAEEGKTGVESKVRRTVDPKTKTASYETFTGRTGHVYGDDRYGDINILHESLHFAGLNDRYDAYGKPNEGFENDIMGKRGATDINDAHYDNYGNYVKSVNPTGSSYLNKMYVDTDSRGNVIAPTKKQAEKPKK